MHPVLFAISTIVIAGTLTAAAAQTPSPYAGQQQRTIKALSDDEVRDLQEGRGMGLAKAAELNSYPGPLHVLQLEKELSLTDAQRSASAALYGDMRDKAQAIGRKIIDAERELDQVFAGSKITADSLGPRLSAISVLQGELRAIHLTAHLAQGALLTPGQIIRYGQLRGYGAPAVPHAQPRHGGG